MMTISFPYVSRRRFLRGAALGASAWLVPGAFAQELVRTPAQTEGPFYPNRLPLDTDNDLLIINDSINPAVGTVAHVSGRILDRHGQPVRNALVEIWQADNNGVYIHSGSANKDKADGNFQGFGKFLTGSTGEYYFRTIKPVPYVPRTPHIHYKVMVKGHEELVTQLYVRGEPMNERDGVYRGIGDQAARELVTQEFAPIPDSRIGEVAARFDIVLGYTPNEARVSEAH